MIFSNLKLPALARRCLAAWRILSAAMALCSLLTAQQWPSTEVNNEQAERQRWFYEQRTYPLGAIPPGARLNAVRRIQQMNAASRRRLAGRPSGALAVDKLGVTMDAANWRSIGPQPTDRGTTLVSAGRVSAIALDPRNSNVVYIGAAEGGVWKTTDGGVTWIPLTDGQASLASGSIAIDPVNPDTVYVGTGEENYSDRYYGAGILKSTDGGATWSNIVGHSCATPSVHWRFSPATARFCCAPPGQACGGRPMPAPRGRTPWLEPASPWPSIPPTAPALMPPWGVVPPATREMACTTPWMAV